MYFLYYHIQGSALGTGKTLKSNIQGPRKEERYGILRTDNWKFKEGSVGGELCTDGSTLRPQQ
jgi:hypothetical protein